MAQNLNIPFFPSPPDEYNKAYFAQLVRNFAVYAEQMRVPGPQRATSLTLTSAAGNVDTGILSYNSAEDTLDLQHLNGVVQQVGFETYMRCKNETGVTIPNGAVVGFSGVNSEVRVAPYIADGTVEELYFIGVTTFEMVDDAVGPVTLYGKVRDIDTTGTPVGEVWAVGDILYASPTTAGALTKVRPTAPQAVIAVAVVIVVDATAGEILVRPTVPIGMAYGSFSSTVDQSLAAINTATAVTFNTTEIADGISIGTPVSRLVVTKAGFYQVSLSLQLTSNSSSAKTVYVWLQKNGTDVADSTRAFTTDVNAGETPLAITYSISLAASDYIELYWAADSTNVALSAITGLAFAPDAPSVLATVVQVQL